MASYLFSVMFATTLLSISTLNIRAGLPVGGLGYHPALEILQHFCFVQNFNEGEQKKVKVWSSLCFICPLHLALPVIVFVHLHKLRRS